MANRRIENLLDQYEEATRHVTEYATGSKTSLEPHIHALLTALTDEEIEEVHAVLDQKWQIGQTVAGRDWNSGRVPFYWWELMNGPLSAERTAIKSKAAGLNNFDRYFPHTAE